LRKRKVPQRLHLLGVAIYVRHWLDVGSPGLGGLLMGGLSGGHHGGWGGPDLDFDFFD